MLLHETATLKLKQKKVSEFVMSADVIYMQSKRYTMCFNE